MPERCRRKKKGGGWWEVAGRYPVARKRRYYVGYYYHYRRSLVLSWEVSGNGSHGAGIAAVRRLVFTGHTDTRDGRCKQSRYRFRFVSPLAPLRLAISPNPPPSTPPSIHISFCGTSFAPLTSLLDHPLGQNAAIMRPLNNSSRARIRRVYTHTHA